MTEKILRLRERVEELEGAVGVYSKQSEELIAENQRLRERVEEVFVEGVMVGYRHDGDAPMTQEWARNIYRAALKETDDVQS